MREEPAVTAVVCYWLSFLSQKSNSPHVTSWCSSTVSYNLPSPLHRSSPWVFPKIGKYYLVLACRTFTPMEPWSHWWYATLSGSGVDTVWVSAGCCEFTESLLTLHCVEASAMSGRPNHLAIVQGRNWTDFFWGHWTAGGSDFAVVEITSALICRTVAKPFDPGRYPSANSNFF